MSEYDALPTPYGGNIFRSRMEARWAVLFDELSISYQYEPEGFALGGEGYIPDFYLDFVRMFAEVKPRELDKRERCLATKLAVATRCPVLMLVGGPDFRTYDAVQPVFIDEGVDSETVDYLLDVDSYKKLHREGRLFGCTGLDRGPLPSLMFTPAYRQAVFTAKTKRFDESGRW